MPVTAKLSKSFYERLGDAATSELVDWLNAVDADYRAQLRELDELNFARFDAKLEQRFAQSDARADRRFAEFEVRIEQRFAAADVKMEQRFASVDVKMERRFAAFEVGFAQFETRLTGRMLAFYTSQTVALAALMYAMLHGR